MSLTSKHPCPCCGLLTLDEPPPGTFAVCSECRWEDDPVQFADPDYCGGSNQASLNEARRAFKRPKTPCSFPRLAYLMSAYFHQDWALESHSDLGVVKLFQASEPPAFSQELRNEILCIQREGWREDELAVLFKGTNTSLSPGCSWSEWIDRIHSTLTKAVETGSS